MDNELDQGSTQEQEQQVETETVETPAAEETAGSEEQTQAATPAPTRKGPPEVLPYERFQQENRARRAAEARAAALEEENARLKAGTQAPPKKRTEEHEFIAEAVQPLIDQVRGETREVSEYVSQLRDEQEANRFWSDPKVNPDLKDRVEEIYESAKQEARARGQKLSFSRRDIYVYERGLMAEASEAEARAQADKTRAAASASNAQLAQVNKIAKAEGGGTAQKQAPKDFSKMTPRERAKHLEEQFGDKPF